jgi:hypothetical protein
MARGERHCALLQPPPIWFLRGSRMYFVRRSILPILLLGAAMLTGRGDAAPANSAPPPPPVTNTIASQCASSRPTPDDLKASTSPVSLAPLTEQVGAGEPTDLIIFAPADAPPLAKLNYTVQIKGEDAHVNAIEPPITSQQAIETQIKKIGLADGRNAVVLQVNIPPANRLNPFYLSEAWTITILGCSQTGQTQAGIYTRRTVKVTEPNVARFWAAVLVLILYLVAASSVWAQRKAAATLSTTTTPTPPLRIETIQAWSWWRCLNPIMLTSDMYDRGSLSQLQILFFAGITLFGMTELALTTGGLSSLSPTIVYLLGIPAAGTLSAQFVGAAWDRLSAENWAWLVNRGVLPLNDPGKRTPRWRDLIMADDSEVDLSKLQALGFSIVVGISLARAGFSGLGSFTVPSEVLQILALSQVVFVGGRFTKPATMGDIDILVTKLRDRYAILRRSAKAGVDINPDGTPGTPPDAPAPPIATFAEATTRLPNAVAQYSEIAEEVTILLDGLTHRSIDRDKIKEPNPT